MLLLSTYKNLKIFCLGFINTYTILEQIISNNIVYIIIKELNYEYILFSMIIFAK